MEFQSPISGSQTTVAITVEGAAHVFQSPISGSQTMPHSPAKRGPLRFQSPISGSQTIIFHFLFHLSILFQSPISGSQTNYAGSRDLIDTEVSIPYKRVTNLSRSKPKTSSDLSFNPL